MKILPAEANRKQEDFKMPKKKILTGPSISIVPE